MPPWLFFAFTVSLLAALGYQILRLQSLRRVPLYWIVILTAFVLAEIVADSSHLGLIRLGELAIIPDFIGVGIALLLLRSARL